MTIAEASRKYGLSADALRYYERVGIIPRVPRTKSGIRDYDEASCGSAPPMRMPPRRSGTTPEPWRRCPGSPGRDTACTAATAPPVPRASTWPR
ncbi:MAG: MerR family DNA-binding transcriptional regulator [Oscillospiraceae bacterium]|nr:MerR family DNA-binding transcriptional regulator [Oscillospiraceae bacterium]